MARTFHGITRFDYGTTSAPATELSGIVTEQPDGEGSRIEFVDEENNPVDVYGNQFGGVLYTRWVIVTTDTADATTIRTNWLADTLQWFKATLDNSETFTTDNGLLLESVKPVTIQGRKRGRADVWEIIVNVPYEDITIA